MPFRAAQSSAGISAREVLPSIVGTIWGNWSSGVALTCDPGTWSGATYQWTRDGAEIVGATSPTYLLTASDIGPEIDCEVTDGADTHNAGPISAYFDDIEDLAACWDCRDATDTAGALTAWVDRVHGYALAKSGAVSIDTSINGKRTIVFGGAGGLTTTGNVSSLSGAYGVTPLIACSDTSSGTAHVVLEYSPSASANAGFLWYARLLTVSQFNFLIRGTLNSESYATDTLATAAVWSAIGDFRRTSGEAHSIFKGGAIQSVTNVSDNNNAWDASLGDFKLSIGQREGGTLRWTGKLVGAIPIYSRPLEWVERQYAELILGYLSGISVSVVDQVHQGAAFGMAGQSNSEGRDTDLSSLPSPWPHADVAASLTKASSTVATYSALVEPVNGIGGTHAISFADAMIRNAAFSADPKIAIVPAPPVGSTSITVWGPGTANYRNMRDKLYTARAQGYRLAGLLWYQGEADTNDLTLATLHASRTQAMFDALRSDLEEPTLPIVVFRIHATNPGFTYWTTVRDGQLTLADANTVVVDAAGALMGDDVHLTTLAQKTTGETAATAYLSAFAP